MHRMLLLAVLVLAGCATRPAGPPPHYVVFFEAWSAKLGEPALGAISAAADWAKQHPDSVVTVSGFADPEGGPQANKDLSRLRAQVVADALVADGVPQGRIRRRAIGSVAYTLDSLESRRVEIALGAG
jgi:cytochrome c oxidase subunit 2